MSAGIIKTIKTSFLEDTTFSEKWQNVFREILKSRTIAEFAAWQKRYTTGFWSLDDLYQEAIGHGISLYGEYEFLKILRGKLKASGCIQIFEALEKSHLTSEPLWFNIKHGIEPFYGREKEISQLFTIYSNETSGDIVNLCGLPGMGKTELVKQFLNNKQIKTKVPAAWLSSDSATSFNTDVRSLAKQILSDQDFHFHKENTGALLENIGFTISSTVEKKWILVLDGCAADIVDPQILDTLKGSKAMVVLINNDRHQFLYQNFIDVTELDEESALKYVKYNLEYENETSMRDLCQFVNNYPLALEQATIYIKYKKRHSVPKYYIHDYIKEYKTRSETLISIKLNQFGGSKYEKTIYETLSTTIDRVQVQSNREDSIQRYSLSLLQICAFLGRDNIDLKFLKELFQFSETEIVDGTFNKSLNLLKALCLIKCDGNECLQINPIVQEVVRYRDQGAAEDSQGLKYIHNILTQLEISILSTLEIRHFLSIWDNIKKDAVFLNQVDYIAPKIFSRLDKLHLYLESLHFAESTIQSFRSSKIKEEDDPLVIEMTQNVGLALRRLGRGTEAIQCLETLVELHKNISDNPTLETLKTLQHLANSYYSIKSYEKALELYNSVYEGKKQFFDLNSREINQCESNIAGALIDLKKFDPAQEKLSNVLKWQRENGQLDDAIRTGHSLGYCYYKMGKYTEANMQFEDVLKQKSERGEENDPRALVTKFMLARTIYHLNDPSKAIASLRDTYKTQVRVVGVHDPEAIETKNRISKYLVHQGQTSDNLCPIDTEMTSGDELISASDKQTNFIQKVGSDMDVTPEELDHIKDDESTNSKTHPNTNALNPGLPLLKTNNIKVLKRKYQEQKWSLKKQSNDFKLEFHQRMVALLKKKIAEEEDC